jgi:hypothetical protein
MDTDDSSLTYAGPKSLLSSFIIWVRSRETERLAALKGATQMLPEQGMPCGAHILLV